MAFGFALATVLRARRERAEAEHRTLGLLERRLREAQRTLRWLESEMTADAGSGRRRSAVSPERMGLLEGARAETAARVAELARRTAEQRVVTEQACREREQLEEMEAGQRMYQAAEGMRRAATWPGAMWGRGTACGAS